MRYLIDATTARHSGALTDFIGLLPALDKLLAEDEQCLVLGTPQLAKSIAEQLTAMELQVLDLPEGYQRARGLNTVVKQLTAKHQPHAALYGLFASLGTSCPFVLRFTNLTLIDPGYDYCRRFLSLRTRIGNSVRKQYFRNSARKASCTVCSTAATQRMLAAWEPRLRSNQLVSAHFGPPQLPEGRIHPGIAGRRLLTMHMTPHKNIELLLNALALPQLAGWSLSVMGSIDDPNNKYAMYLQETMRALGLKSRVHFLGYLHSQEQLRAALHNHDILVVPSRMETWSHTVVEGLGIGMPVIASDIPTHREVACGAAWLTSVNDPGMFAETVVRAAEDRGETASRIANGFEIVGGLSWSRHAQVILDVLRKAAGRVQN